MPPCGIGDLIRNGMVNHCRQRRNGILGLWLGLVSTTCADPWPQAWVAYCTLLCYAPKFKVRVDGTGRKYGVEPLMDKYSVDVYLAGHEHNYERLYPVLNGQ